ncbi:MAG: NnrU family protein [Candidatus Competibacter sp.]|nr:NnrU family protein [Candidatus Competibacter sp.]MDG4583170.1 NnrU family protein [Candidatus Competibacter sp.]
MGVLLLGLIIFFAVHSLSIVNKPWRDRQAARLDEGPWQAAYSLAALIGFGLIVWGYGLARHDPLVLYWPPVWLRHLALLLMVPVFPLLLAAYLPGRIQTAVKHPMLAATKLWAVAHLLANGMLADVLLFGAFLVWAVVDRISLRRRALRPVPGAPPSKANDPIAVVGGLALYVAFVLWLHLWLIGVSPIAR